jgi:hypothetical protein
MSFWHCEVASPLDYIFLVLAAASWCYAGYCLIQLRYERRRPLLWWEPVPFGRDELTPLGREYQRRFYLSLFAGACAMMLAVALCAGR